MREELGKAADTGIHRPDHRPIDGNSREAARSCERVTILVHDEKPIRIRETNGLAIRLCPQERRVAPRSTGHWTC